MIDFELEPEFSARLDWVREFVDTKVAKLDALWPSPASPHDRSLVEARRILAAMQAEVKARGL